MLIRYSAWLVCLIAVPVCIALALATSPAWWWPAGIAAALALLGLRDLLQRDHTLLRNYPLMAWARYLIESIRPEIRQYLLEGDEDQTPFSRSQRSLIYQRAKNTLDKRPFGTQLDVYRPQYEWINHSLHPADVPDFDFRIRIGGPDCTQPYSASVFNISAMSFGSLSAAAIRALNAGAKMGGFYHDTGEGSISRHHREHGGDLVWEIGSGYFGCRDADGKFSEERFVENAGDPQVKMIELKLSQGAKPGQGGILPGAKVSAEIAEARGVTIGVDCLSPARHSAFDTPIGLLQFIAKLRELSGGKPTGFKLAIGHPWEWFAIARAMLETGITPDFIVVDGGEGGTGAAPLEFTNHVGAPLTEALILVHNTLVGLNLRPKIKVGAAGKLVSAFDMARTLAIGADWCNSARGYMFALGCIQSQSCHTDKCPTGIATQDASRQRGLVVPDKAERVYHFHHNTVKALRDLIAAAGLTHPDQLGPEHIIRRVSGNEIRALTKLHYFVKPGELLADKLPAHPVFEMFWPRSRADSFAAPDVVEAYAKS